MDLSKFLEKKAKEVKRYIDRDAPRIVAKMARDHAKQSFQDEGFTDDTFQKWDEVKRRKEENLKRGKRGGILKKQAAAQTRKILTGESKDLKKSIQSDIISSELVEIGSDLEDYPKAHNEGTDNAGRNHNVKLPKRQFLGKSKQLEKQMTEKFEKDLTKILND